MNECQMKNYKNGYGYVRYSTDEQGDGNTEARQVEYIEKMSKELNVPLIKIYYDRGVSALKGHNLNKSWNQLKLMISKNDVILVEDVDRITRKESRTFYNVLGEIVEDREGFIILTSPRQNKFEINRDNYQSDWGLRVGNVVSSEEGKKRMERSQNGMDRMISKLKSGKWAKSASTPWWIISDEVSQCFRVDEDRAKVVEFMYSKYIDGYSMRKIASVLNKTIVRTKRGRSLTCGTINYFLRTRAVLGYYYKNDNDNIKLYPPIINEDVFWTVQKRKKERRRCSGRNPLKPNLFKSIIFCAECGRPMQFMQDNRYKYNKEGVILRYICSGAMTAGNGCSYQGLANDHFEESLRKLLSKSEIISKFIAKGVVPEPLKVDTLKLRLADIRTKEVKLSNIITNDPEPSQSLIKSLKDVEALGREISIELDKEQAILRSASPTMAMISEFNKSNFISKWNDPEERLKIREILRCIIEKVVVNKVEKSYEVFFNGEVSSPIKVEVGKKDYTINGTKFQYE